MKLQATRRGRVKLQDEPNYWGCSIGVFGRRRGGGQAYGLGKYRVVGKSLKGDGIGPSKMPNCKTNPIIAMQHLGHLVEEQLQHRQNSPRRVWTIEEKAAGATSA
jgi:hypothetical protein